MTMTRRVNTQVIRKLSSRSLKQLITENYMETKSRKLLYGFTSERYCNSNIQSVMCFNCQMQLSKLIWTSEYFLREKPRQ